jgi:hypothetical protein
LTSILLAAKAGLGPLLKDATPEMSTGAKPGKKAADVKMKKLGKYVHTKRPTKKYMYSSHN